MKRSVLLLFAAVFFFAAAPTQAQISTKLGLKGGFNVSTLRSDLEDIDVGDIRSDIENDARFIGGVFWLIDLLGPLDVQLEALYTQKGTTIDLGDTPAFGDVTIDADLDYIEVPALLKFRLPIGPLKPSIFGGGAVAYKINEELEAPALNVEEDTDFFDDFDYSAVAGVSIDFKLPAFPVLTLDARYTLGLKNIPDEFEPVIAEIDENLDADDVKNGVFSLTLGVGLGL